MGVRTTTSGPAKRPGAGLARWLRNWASTARSTVQTCTRSSTAATRARVNGSSRKPRTVSPRSIWRSTRRNRCQSCSLSATTNAPVQRARHMTPPLPRRSSMCSARPVGCGSARAGIAWPTAADSSQRHSGIAPAAPVIPICTPTFSSQTSPAGRTAAGRLSTAGSCMCTPRPPATCTRPHCDTSSPPGWPRLAAGA
jgi:hypothetical protein